MFRKVHNCTHFKWWFTQFEQKCNILEIFHYFQYFERFRSMKKWQISKPKIVDWYLDFTKESYTALKSVISSFKICFQNYGQLKRKFLGPKNTSSTFLKFELSRLNGPMLTLGARRFSCAVSGCYLNNEYQTPVSFSQDNVTPFAGARRSSLGGCFWISVNSLATAGLIDRLETRSRSI